MKNTARRPRQRLALAFLALATSAAVTLVATGPSQAASAPLATNTVVVASPTTSHQGDQVAITATVHLNLSAKGLLVTPSGSVSFSASNGITSVPLGSATVGRCLLTIGSCTATVRTTALPAGTAVAITAQYAGDTISKPSAGQTTVTVLAPPSAPISLSGTAGQTTAALTWSAPLSTGSSAIDHYTVYRSTATGVKGASVATVPAGSTTYTDHGLAQGTHYYYEVSASNATDEGPTSNQVVVTPTGTPLHQAPAAPTLTGVSQVGSTQLTWSTASTGGDPITGYNLYRSTVTGGGSTAYVEIASNLPSGSFQDTTGTVGTTYQYKATATNTNGESGFSNVVSESPTSTTPAGTNTTTCAPGPSCTSSADATGFDSNGDKTTLEVDAQSSTQTQTLTATVGGPELDTNQANCSTPPPAGLPATFNDTATDAYKTVKWTVYGAAADAVYAGYNPTPGYEGCLGLGTQWYAGSPSNPATWTPSDGLYEASPPLCVNNGAFSLGGGHFSQPCVNVTYMVTGSAPHYYEIDYVLPPGDGRISGGGG